MSPHRDPLDLHQVGAVNERVVKRLALARDMIWIFLGLAGVLAAAQFFLDPGTTERSSIGRNLDGPVDDLWYSFWAMGGLTIMYGIIRLRPRTEIVGQMFFLAGILPNAVAIAIEIGGGPSFWTIMVAGFANAGRIYYLWHVTPKKQP